MVTGVDENVNSNCESSLLWLHVSVGVEENNVTITVPYSRCDVGIAAADEKAILVKVGRPTGATPVLLLQLARWRKLGG